MSLRRILTNYSEHLDPLKFEEKQFQLLIIGFPIRRHNKDYPSEIHWQPILIDNWKDIASTVIAGFRPGKAPAKLAHKVILRKLLASKSQIWWIKSANIHHSRYFGRGKMDNSIIERHIAVFGVGAVGLQLANYLVREGLKELDIFDGDRVEPGNLCRHAFGIKDIGRKKVEATGDMLTDASPHLKLNKTADTLPFGSDSEGWRTMLASDLWINCTASERISAWLSNVAIENKKELVTIYITYGAKYLCMYGSGDSVPAHVIHEALLGMRGQPSCSVPDDFFAARQEQEMFTEGTGCWYPTFPARLHDISMLVAYAVDRLNSKLCSGSQQGWAMVVGKCDNQEFGGKPSIRCFLESDQLV